MPKRQFTPDANIDVRGSDESRCFRQTKVDHFPFLEFRFTPRFHRTSMFRSKMNSRTLLLMISFLLLSSSVPYRLPSCHRLPCHRLPCHRLPCLPCMPPIICCRIMPPMPPPDINNIMNMFDCCRCCCCCIIIGNNRAAISVDGAVAGAAGGSFVAVMMASIPSLRPSFCLSAMLVMKARLSASFRAFVPNRVSTYR